VGYTPELAVAVWMGFDDPGAGHALPDYEGGSASPARLCTAMLKSAAPLLSGNDFPVPAGLAAADIDRVALEESGQVLLATAATPEAYVQREWFYADDRPTESTRLWSAPAAVDDLRILSGRGESPSLAFTCRDNSAEYLILRRTGDSTQLAAVLTPEPDSLVVWTDVQADLNLVHEYSVLPRHRLLYECGTLLTGPESERVQYAPRGLLSSLFDS